MKIDSLPNGVTTFSDISGTKIKYSKAGSGSPTIVFMSGHRTPMSNWQTVADKAAVFTTVVAYDRLDTGGSGKSSSPQDGNTIVRRLKSLLDEIDVEPPYVLVAHSLGGLYANLYARYYPNDVIGVVFVEGAHPSEAAEQPANNDTASRLGSLLKNVFKPGFKKDPNSEYNNVKQTVSQIEKAVEFPEIPIAVVTGGMKMPFVPKESYTSHLEWQKRLSTISPNGYQIVAEKSGHTPQISEPQLVVEQIERILSIRK